MGGSYTWENTVNTIKGSLKKLWYSFIISNLNDFIGWLVTK